MEVAPKLGAETHIYSLVDFSDELYGGTYPNGKLYEWNETDAWVEVASKLGAETAIYSLVDFSDELYGGTNINGKLYEWRTKPESVILWDDYDDGNLATNTTDSTTVTGLTTNTNYYLALFAIDESGNYSTADVTTTDSTEYKRTIVGDVFDDKTALIASATVRLYNKTSGALLDSTTSNSSGAYSFTIYGSLTYQVVCYKDGYASDVIDSLEGTIDGETVVEDYDFTLDGSYTKSYANDANILVGRGEGLVFITTTKDLTLINPSYDLGAINPTYALDDINPTKDLGEISITKSID